MKYSVIVPVYNAEKTLRRCLDSLCAAACPEAEILLIDDGSTDASAAICRSYDDPRFRLIQKENGGVSSARNLGLDCARGEYVLFVDSDDYVEPDYFARLDRLDPEGQYDYLLFSYYRFNGTEKTQRELPGFASVDPAGYGPMLARAYRSKWINAPWNKRYRRSLLEAQGLRFHTGLPIAEDTLFNLKYLLCCRGLCISNDPLYTVSLENPDSLSRKVLPDRRALLALADREAEQAILTAPVSPELREQMIRSRNFLLLSDIYSEGKQLHLAQLPLTRRWKTLRGLCREYRARRLSLPGDLLSRLLALPVRLGLAPVIDLLSRKLAK